MSVLNGERRTVASFGYRNGETVPYMGWKKLYRRERKVESEGMVTGWQVLILEIGLKIYWNKKKNETKG
jgi:hypothetical protein